VDLENALGATAYIHPDEIAPFIHYAEAARNLVEIGCGYGATAVLMLRFAPPDATVISIDPFLPDSMGGWQAMEAAARENVARACRVWELGGALERWMLYATTSHQAAAFTKEWAIDFLFIDGDHRYEAVRQDVDLWLPHLAPGGVLLLHDSRHLPTVPPETFDHGWPGPTRVAEELRADRRVTLLEEAYSLTIWRVNEDAPVKVKTERRRAKADDLVSPAGPVAVTA
jgi:predicted O-methyltransferase YrrM